jgi:hypothetical protein
VRNAEDNRCEEGKHGGGAEVAELERHCFFPMAMW